MDGADTASHHHSSQASPGKQASPFDMETARLTQNLDELEITLGTLYERLMPVTHPDEPHAIADKEMDIRPPMSSVVLVPYNAASRVALITDSVRAIRDRLDI